jgi:hypothetical protein
VSFSANSDFFRITDRCGKKLSRPHGKRLHLRPPGKSEL